MREFIVKLRIVLWASVAALGLSGAAQSEADKIVYPVAAAGSNEFITYYWSIIDMVCERTIPEFGPCDISQTDAYMNHLRALEELSKGGISLYVRAYLPPEFQGDLQIVPFPLDRGLIGHRIALINKNRQDEFALIRTEDDLKGFSIGQGLVWLDSDILESAGMNLVRVSSYDGLFSMVESGRIDLFTRGLNEVMGEYRERASAHPDLGVESSLIISYPMSFYFVVSKDAAGQRLKERLVLGLDRMVEDGSFEAHFQMLFDTVTAGLNIENRHVIRLQNNFYDNPDYRLDDPTAWLSLTNSD